MSDHVPPSFRNYCSAEIHCDENGEECALTISCALIDKRTGEPIEFEKTIDLQPITKFIANQLIAHHASLHGHDAVEVAGIGSFLSKAKDSAKRVATSAGVKAVYNKIKGPALQAAASTIPGGSIALAAATKTYDEVRKARQGDKKALAKIKATAKLAASGDPLAAQVMQTAKTLNALQAIKESKDPPDMANRVSAIEAILNPLWHPAKSASGGVSVSGPMSMMKKAAKYHPLALAAKYHPAALAHKALTKKPKKAAPRRPSPMPLRAAPLSPHARMAPPSRPLPPPPLEEAPEVLEEMSDAMADDGYGEEEIADAIDTTVAGWREWLHSRPYRTPAQAMLQGDYGLSTSLRSLYANGMATLLSRHGG